MDLAYFADEADIHLIDEFLRDLEHPAVLAGDSDCRGVAVFEQLDDILVDFPRKDHFRNSDRFLVGHAVAVDKFCLDLKIVQHRRNILAAAVYDNRPQSDKFHQRHVVHDALLDVFVVHEASAVLDDDGLLSEFLYVRQSFDEYVGFLNILVEVLLGVQFCHFNPFGPSCRTACLL